VTGEAKQRRGLKQFLRARLSREEVLGLHLTVGAVTLIAATWLFSVIAEDIINKEQLSTWDVEISNTIHAHATRSVTIAMLIITNLHSTVTVGIFASAITIYFLRRRLKDWALTFALSVYGGLVLNVMLKDIFQRARPHFDDPIVTLTSYSFPSGHTIVATTFYGALCAFVVSRVHGWAWRVLAIVVALFMIALVGFTRIYLGAHYLSDVLGAMTEGVFWLSLCLTGVHTMRRWRVKRR